MGMRILFILVLGATLYLGNSGLSGWLDPHRARDLSGALLAILAISGLHQFLFGPER